jgi:GNAT superfamily N-acetyltransferase
MKSFKQFLMEFVTDDSVYAFADKVKSELGLHKFDLWKMSTGNVIGLRLIAVSKDKMSEGAGTKAMNMLINFADENKLKIILTPAGKDDRFGTTSKGRLVTFYKRFGFVENKGKGKDYSIMDSMYRDPK